MVKWLFFHPQDRLSFNRNLFHFQSPSKFEIFRKSQYYLSKSSQVFTLLLICQFSFIHRHVSGKSLLLWVILIIILLFLIHFYSQSLFLNFISFYILLISFIVVTLKFTPLFNQSFWSRPWPASSWSTSYWPYPYPSGASFYPTTTYMLFRP